MQYQSFGVRYQLRLESGDELMDSLVRFAEKTGVRFATFQGLGASRRSRVGWFDNQQRDYRVRNLDEQLEVVSINGNIALRDGKPFVHAHATLGSSDLSLIGGHVMQLVVRPTLELAVRQEAAEIVRLPDDESGLALLDLAERL